jgi:hypothetical protein
MIEQLEELYDSSAADERVDMRSAPSIELRSGDELAAEVEEFLRGQD